MAQSRTTRPAPRTRLQIFDRTADKLAQSNGPDDALIKLAKQWLALDEGQKNRFLATLSRTGSKRSTSRSTRSSRSSKRSSADATSNRSTRRSSATRKTKSESKVTKEEPKKDKKKKKDKEKKKDKKAAKRERKEKKRKKKEKKAKKGRKGKGGASAGEPMSPNATIRAEGTPSPSTESSPMIPPDTAH